MVQHVWPVWNIIDHGSINVTLNLIHTEKYNSEQIHDLIDIDSLSYLRNTNIMHVSQSYTNYSDFKRQNEQKRFRFRNIVLFVIRR